MRMSTRVRAIIFLNLLAVFAIATAGWARNYNKSQFMYVGGTEPLSQPCEGNLDITETAMVFECREARVTVPYNSITHMEYRSRVSPQVRKMKLQWVLKPPSHGGRRNLFFTVLYLVDGSTHAMILKVPPETMLPYLAEIDLRVGHRINVERYY